MTKKTKSITISFDCPCEKQLSLFKTFEVTEGTPPEAATFDCPSCDRNIKLTLENQLVRDKPDLIYTLIVKEHFSPFGNTNVRCK